MNYFQLFNIPEQFDIDLARLAATYQSLQKLTHPDKFAAAGEREQRLAVQKNAQVNDGYQVLKTPVSRAEHLLALRGVELQHEQRTMRDPAFLMQQMEWREQLADLADDDEALDQLDALNDEIEQHYQRHIATLAKLLDSGGEQQNQQAADEIRKLKFMLKMQQEIALKEDAIADF